MQAPTFELSQRFYFEAAHTLRRLPETGEVDSSLRVHGHTYEAEVTVRGAPDESGMVIDLALLRRHLETVRQKLDHRFLDEIPGLAPATLENLCAYIARELALPGLCRVHIWRKASGDSCTLIC